MNKPFEVSSCCKDQLIVCTDDEGTSHWECRACGKACDIWVDNKKSNGKKSKAQNWIDTLESKDYEELIEWAEREIEEYKKLIVILKKGIK